LTAPEFARLADVPPEAQWFANLDSAQTRRAYQGDLRAFMAFTGIVQPEEFRAVTRAHILAWRAELEKQMLAAATIRRKLAALASLYDYLCECNAVTHNPVRGVKRPKAETSEGKTPALGDAQARRLLDAPPSDTLKGRRDRAILSVLLYHGLRREELTKLLVKDFNQERRGVPHLRVQGKGGKLRYLPAHPHSLRLVAEYLAASGHGQEADGPLFRRTRAPRAGACCGADALCRVLRGRGALYETAGHHRREHGAARAARHGGHLRAGAPGRHCQGPGVAGAREHQHHPARLPAGGFADLQGGVLILYVDEIRPNCLLS